MTDEQIIDCKPIDKKIIIDLARKVWSAGNNQLYIGPGFDSLIEFSRLIENEIINNQLLKCKKQCQDQAK